MKDLNNTIQEIINQHQKMTPKVQSDLGKIGFMFRDVGKYLGIRSKNLFLVKNSSFFYVGIGMAATQYGYYEENFGMCKKITEAEFKELKYKGYRDLTGSKHIWL